MTPQQIEALKLALEALEACNIYGELECVMTPDSAIYLHPAITAIKEALADPMREVQRLGQEIEQEPPQRTWVGLKEEDYVLVNQLCINPIQAAEFVDRLLKEKNT